MKTCDVCGKEHEKNIVVTMMDKEWAYCSIGCVWQSGHADFVKQKIIDMAQAQAARKAKGNQP